MEVEPNCKTVSDILALATDVLGNPKDAIYWMSSRIPVLSMRTPIDVMYPGDSGEMDTEGLNVDPEGIRLAETILMRIRYGIYS